MTVPDPFAPRTTPTIYFIGVTTSQSSIMRIFPRWAEILGLNAAIAGYDAPLHAPAETYKAIVEHVKRDPLTAGALVTTRKIDLLAATHDLFDDLDPSAQLCREISCIAKRDGRLEGYAMDPISSGKTWQGFVEPGYFGRTGAHVTCMGAGGAATAISVYVAGLTERADRPEKFVVIDRSLDRLNEFAALVGRLNTDVNFECVLNEDPRVNDNIMAKLPPGSMVINATGMGKDRPGSPITDAARFPDRGLVWELNYRGALDFLQQARHQAAERNLKIEDGWNYFLYGWTQVIAEVFHLTLTPEIFTQLDHAATAIR